MGIRPCFTIDVIAELPHYFDSTKFKCDLVTSLGPCEVYSLFFECPYVDNLEMLSLIAALNLPDFDLSLFIFPVILLL